MKLPNTSRIIYKKISPPKFKVGEAIWSREIHRAKVHMVKIHSVLFDNQKAEWVYFGIRSKYPIPESKAQPYPIFYST